MHNEFTAVFERDGHKIQIITKVLLQSDLAGKGG